MRNLRLISTTAAILLLGAGAVSAENTIKTDETPGAPAAQQNAPPEKIAPAAKPDPIKAPEKTGQTVPTEPESANKKQTTDKAAPAGDSAKVSSDANCTTSIWRATIGSSAILNAAPLSHGHALLCGSWSRARQRCP